MSLLRRKVAILSRIGVNARFESSLKSTVATGSSTILNDTTTSRNRSHFPWRERPHEVKVSWLKEKSFHFFKHHFFGNTSWLLPEKEIVVGAADAFIAFLNGVFQHYHVENVCLKHMNKDDEAFDSSVIMNKDEVPRLSDILESKLAQFYENAILKCSINREDPGYMLISASEPVIVHREIVFGANRANVSNPESIKFASFTFVMDEEDFESGLSFKEIVDKNIHSSFVTVRYWIDVPCEG